MRAPKTPAGGRRALYGAAALFFLAFSVLLGVDRYIWGHTLRSAPFYLRAAERCGEFLLPGILAFLAAWASRRPRGRTSCTAVLALLAAAALLTALAGLWRMPGKPRGDALLRDFTAAEDGSSVTLEMDLASSAGYLRSMEARERGRPCT